MSSANDILEQLDRILREFDARLESFTEFTVADSLDSLGEQCRDQKLLFPTELRAEFFAFTVMSEPGKEDDDRWGSCFRPMMTQSNSDGNVIETPAIDRVTPEVVAYWERRMDESTHPMLKSRYANLVWEFKQKRTGQRADIRFAQIAIDAAIEAIEAKRLKDEHEVEDKIGRSLDLAIRIGDQSRIARVTKTVLHLRDFLDDPEGEQRIACFEFEQLVDRKKAPLDPAVEGDLVAAIEGYLLESAGGSDRSGAKDPWGGERLCNLLMGYYRTKQQDADVKRVLKLWGSTYEAVAADADGMLASAWLQKVHDAYLDAGMTTEAEAVMVKYRTASQKVPGELRLVSASVEIDPDRMDAMIESILDGELSEVLRRIAVELISDADDAKRLLQEVAKESIVMAVMPQQLVDGEGHVIAEIGTLKDDLDGNIILQLSKSMRFESQIAVRIWDQLIAKFELTAEHVMSFIGDLSVFRKETAEILKAGIAAYLAQDYVTAIHLLVPRIEAALRRFQEILGRPVLKRHRGGGMVLKNVDEILRDEKVSAALTSKVTTYLRTLLCDQRGWNVRNIVCHGTADGAFYNRLVADRLMHVVLLLGLIRLTPNPPEQPPA